jgi:hypothetical protein
MKSSLQHRLSEIDRQLKDGLITRREAALLKKRAKEAAKVKNLDMGLMP